MNNPDQPTNTTHTLTDQQLLDTYLLGFSSGAATALYNAARQGMKTQHAQHIPPINDDTLTRHANTISHTLTTQLNNDPAARETILQTITQNT